jgi:NitT/TauT family transport system permease protein
MSSVRIDGAIDAGDRNTPPNSNKILVRGRVGGYRKASLGAQQVARFLSPFLLLIVWEALSRLGALDIRFFPPPSVIAASAVDMTTSGTIPWASLDSLIRLFLGFSSGAIVGVVVGLWLGLSSWSRAIVEPWLLITYPVPKLAIYPLIVLIFGLGDLPIVILLAIAVFYIVAINTTAGVLSTSKSILDVGRDAGASFLQSVTTIALPASLPHIFVGLEIAIGIGYVVLIAGEFLGAKTGLGAIIWSSWQVFDVAPMYVAITVVSLLGYFSTLLVRGCGHALMPWRKAAG